MRKYKKIWNYFLTNEAEAFEVERKLTIKEIKRIGIKKFINANDWRDENDVAKWRTDMLEVIPCPHCGKDFGVMDDTLGLCEKCIKLFSLRNFYEDVADVCGGNPVKVGKALALFMMDKKVRVQYLLH